MTNTKRTPPQITIELTQRNELRLRRRAEGRSKHMAGWNPTNYFNDADESPATGKRVAATPAAWKPSTRFLSALGL